MFLMHTSFTLSLETQLKYLIQTGKRLLNKQIQELLQASSTAASTEFRSPGSDMAQRWEFTGLIIAEGG